MSPWLQDFAYQKGSLRDLVLGGTEGRPVTEADRLGGPSTGRSVDENEGPPRF